MASIVFEITPSHPHHPLPGFVTSHRASHSRAPCRERVEAVSGTLQRPDHFHASVKEWHGKHRLTRRSNFTYPIQGLS